MRTIDFVIKDRNEMFAFLRILLTYMMHFQQIDELKLKLKELRSNYLNPFKRMVERDEMSPEERF